MKTSLEDKVAVVTFRGEWPTQRRL